MKRAFTYTITQEDDLFVAQCLEVDVASQGESPDEAVANLREALELHLEPPIAIGIDQRIGDLEQKP
jgi:predicted RNase H-like HicB family nuclease